MTTQDRPVDGRTSRWAHRRQELLGAATDYVLNHGVADLTLRPMAAAIGVTITTLIRQFGSKDALVEQIARGIHDELLVGLREDPELVGRDPEETLRVLWRRWLDPHQARQFGLLFELYGLALRDRGRYAWFITSVVGDWLAPIEQALIDAGWDREQAETTATLVLALIRGLHLDLAVTGETARVDRAFKQAVNLLSRPPTHSR
ncbi:TetR/AcrR family transcriptional regulator [Spirillospora sp. NPDC029432]|uniref:TetR/AcrR family transcriptional regulator n=1 Tax=Spirillospora sp. NPDC029432 TaxID=3154599 RepID=UPI00345336C1